MKTYTQLYIDGRWTDAASQKLIDVINPATETLAGQAAEADASDVDRAVTAARNAFSLWSRTSAEERAGYISAIARGLTERSEEMTATITAEMGSPLSFCREVHVKDPIDALSRHAQHTGLLDQEEQIGNARVCREPIGVCALITPWNYPLHQLIGKVAPALAAGCTIVLKPSEITPLHAFLLAEVIHESGLPAGVFNLVNGNGQDVGEPLCRHPEVDMISFTGSTRAGVRISQVAAADVKRVCLELGGKSPLLITEDADLKAAVEFGINDVMYNSGQTCTALSRMLIPASRYPEAVEIARQYATTIKVGDPQQADTFMGPMASAMQYEQVRRYIDIGITEGAQLLCGGLEKPAGLEQGYYIAPTIFAGVNNQMQIAREEIFGPVLCIIPYADEAEAIEIANDTPYGLSARVWAASADKATQLAREIRAGQVYINDGVWNNAAPFGGYKQSGNGREMGYMGVEEFFEIKSLLY